MRMQSVKIKFSKKRMNFLAREATSLLSANTSRFWKISGRRETGSFRDGYYLCLCRQLAKRDYQKSLECFQKLIKDYPGSDYRQASEVMISQINHVAIKDKQITAQQHKLRLSTRS